MKLARQYHLEKIPPEPQRDIFLSREQSYHGATFATLALSGHLARQARYKPLMLPNMRKTLPCNAYRYQLSGETEEEYAQRLAQGLEDDILRAGKDRVVAFVAETVGGAVSQQELF
jgi:adenosylmethionine-8-amino-7-oxononanoate aminotransferase